MPDQQPDPVADVVWMIRGYWVSLCLRAAAQLGVFDHLARPASVAQLAQACSSDVLVLTRLLRTLGDLGLVAVDANGQYVTTPRGETLHTGHPAGLRDLVLMQTRLENLASWHRLADAVRGGRGVFEEVNGVGEWEFLAAHPDQQAIFDAAMARRGTQQAEAIRAGCDLSDVGTLVDVGGGKGAMVAALLPAEPRLSAVVAERPGVAEAAEETFAAADLSDRARGTEADFFASVPAGGDAYVLANVLHDWDDRDAIAILRTVRAAMATGARLWIVERVLDAPGRSFEGNRDLHLVDLHMLVLFGARERTVAEYAELLVDAGFGPATLLPTGSDWNVVEAVPV